jgi:hypothetical protein
MASSINASTSGVGGVITTADSSGNLNIQSGGTTVAAVTSAGVAITGTLSASGVITGNGSGLTSIPSPASLSTASGSAPSYSARAWVNFNGTGTIAIRASANVSSVTDNGTGTYTVNFTTAMSDINYAYAIGGQLAASGAANINYNSVLNGALVTTSIPIKTGVVSVNGATDFAIVTCSIFR